MRLSIAKLFKFSLLGVLVLTPVSLVSLAGCGGGGPKVKPTATPTAMPTATPFVPPVTPPSGVFNLYVKQGSDSTYSDTYTRAISSTITTSDSGNLLTVSALNSYGTIGIPEAYRYSFSLKVAHESAFKPGDIFTVTGTTGAVTGSSRRFRGWFDGTWSATSGQVKVLSRSDTLLYLQVIDLVYSRNLSGNVGTVTFNGTLQIPLPLEPTAG